MIATNPTQTTDISLCRRALSHARHPAADIVTARIQRVYLQEVGECDPGLYRGHVTVRALCDRRVALLRRYLLESIADIISTSSTSRKLGVEGGRAQNRARCDCWPVAVLCDSCQSLDGALEEHLRRTFRLSHNGAFLSFGQLLRASFL